MILDRGSMLPKAKNTAGQGPAPGALHEEQAGEQCVADEVGASHGASQVGEGKAARPSQLISGQAALRGA
jgi:hypothetical protein